MKKVRKKIAVPSKSTSFFKKSFISLLAVTISIILMLTIFLTANYLKSFMSLTTDFSQNLLSQTNYSITNLDENVSILMRTLYNNNDVISFIDMNEYDGLIPVLAKRALDKQLVTLSYVDSVFLYNAELDLFYSSKTGHQTPRNQFPEPEIVEIISNPDSNSSANPIIIRNGNADNNAATYISYVFFETLPRNESLKSSIIINIKPSSLTDSLQNISHYQERFDPNFIITDDTGTVISSVLNDKLEESTQLFSSVKERIQASSIKTSQFVTLEGTRYFLSATNKNDNNWFLISLVPTTVFLNDILTSTLVGVLIMLGIILISFGVCFYLVRKLNQPLKALTNVMMKKQELDTPPDALKTEEFQFLFSVFQSMENQNQQLDQFKKETAYSIKQDFLSALISNNQIYTPEQVTTKLKTLNLSYLADTPLCMCVFKLDHYDEFISINNQQEQWALRFAILNIIEETSRQYVFCDVFSHDVDKFILLLDCKESADYKVFMSTLEKMLMETQKNVSKFLKLTVSVAYSVFFEGLEQLPSMYHNMEDALLLRIKCGHGCIINPYMMDDMSNDIFQFAVKKLEQFRDKLSEGKEEEANALFIKLSKEMYQYPPSEIISGMIHLSYSVYTSLSQKYPVIRDDISRYISDFMMHMQKAEIADDLDKAMISLIHNLCMKVIETKNSSAHQNIDSITQRIIEIIEREYPSNALCLSSIAEELRLSPNYVGQIFKTTMGKSVAQYTLDLRFEHLDNYLRTSKMPLNTIIEKVGLEKNNYFYTRFKKHFGVSLSNYFASHQNEE